MALTTPEAIRTDGYNLESHPFAADERQHAPVRFHYCDPYEGVATDPLSLHKYVYCGSDPVNRIDPSGNFFLNEQMVVTGIRATLFAINLYGAYANFRKATFHSIRAYNMFADGRFWDGTVELAAAALHAGMGVFNIFGLKAGLIPPPTSGPGLALVSAEAPGEIFAAMAQNPALRNWVLDQLIPAIGGLGSAKE